MTKRYIFAGFGGQGMLLIGKFVAMANMLEGKHVSWLPSYGPEMRGGTANCSVIVSDEPIGSPIVHQADAIVAMNLPSMLKFESEVKPGGVLVVNSSLIDRKCDRDDIKVIKVPATDIANKLDNHRGTNIIMLGALAGASDLYDVDHVREGMNHYFEKKGKNNPKNVAAFDAGAEAAQAQL